jgi:hypothetical protein
MGHGVVRYCLSFSVSWKDVLFCDICLPLKDDERMQACENIAMHTLLFFFSSLSFFFFFLR